MNHYTIIAIAGAASIIATPLMVSPCGPARVSSSLDATTNAPMLITTTDIAPTNAFLAAIATSPPAALPIETPLTGPTNHASTGPTSGYSLQGIPHFDPVPAYTERWLEDLQKATMPPPGHTLNIDWLRDHVMHPEWQFNTNFMWIDMPPITPTIETNAIAGAAFASGFSQGIRYGLLAATRNPDVHDARILAMIALELWKREKGTP